MRDIERGADMEKRSFRKVCVDCGKDFLGTGPKAKKCQDCRKCKWCGNPLTFSRSQFCDSSCFGKWNYTQNSGTNLTWENLDTGQQEKRGVSISKAKTGVSRTDRGELNANWKGNKSERRTSMERLEYKVWRATVFKRDGYTCVICHERSKRMEAHHILPWAEYVELRYSVSNGVTLCKTCHDAIAHKESEFKDRFIAYVAAAAVVVLTEEERAKFEPIYVQCSDCGKDKRISAWHLKKKWHFCDMTCKRSYEKKIGSNWGLHSK